MKRTLILASALFLIGLFLFIDSSQSATPPGKPSFSHPPGTFIDHFYLHLSADDGSEIYYTLDGEKPDLSSQKYSKGDSIPVFGTTIIRARAYRQADDDRILAGPSTTKIYSRLHPELADFNSNLPLVIVHQFEETMLSQCSDEPDNPDDPLGWGAECDRTTVYFSVIEPDDSGRTHLLSDRFHIHSRSESNYRGTSSLALFPKRQFGVRFIDEDNENRNESVLGMPSENNWIMYAPYDDKTLIRNAVAYRLSRDMGRYAPRTRFVELFLVDGLDPVTEDDYHGVYMLTERIKWDDSRVDITKVTENDNSEPEITGGYIINYDRDIHFRSNSDRETEFALVRPQHEDITQEQRDWISGYIGDLERALFGPDFDDPHKGYAAYLEPESFIDHHLITELFKEIDGYRLSTYLYKDREGPLVMGPVWDYNISMGNVNYYVNRGIQPDEKPWEPEGWYYDLLTQKQYMNGWYHRLFRDPDFSRRYRDRWWELRDGPFSTDHIINMIRNYAEYLDEAQQRNFRKWEILGKYVWPNRYYFDTYEEEVDFIVDWVRQRLKWMDSQMGTPPDRPQSQLRYFWYFGDEMANDTPFETIDAGLSLVDSARIHFSSALEGYPFDEGHPDYRKASMERRNRPTDINYRPEGNHGRPYDHSRMRALQVRQPFVGDGGENELVFEVPTTGLEDVVFRFAAMDEAAADALLIDYSVDGVDGENISERNWTSEGLKQRRHPLTFEYRKYEIDFSEAEGAADNPDFGIRIRFDGENLSADNGNRVTFNNFSLGSAADQPRDTRIEDEEMALPQSIRLEQNYPNPFNSKTVITFSLPQQSEVRLTVYDILGRVVGQLVNRQMPSGEHSVSFDAAGLAGGVYLYELQAGGRQRLTRKMTLIK